MQSGVSNYVARNHCILKMGLLMTRVDLENSRERCMEVKAIYQTGCRKRGRHATRGPCGSSAGGADSVKRVGSRESEDRGQVLI